MKYLKRYESMKDRNPERGNLILSPEFESMKILYDSPEMKIVTWRTDSGAELKPCKLTEFFFNDGDNNWSKFELLSGCAIILHEYINNQEIREIKIDSDSEFDNTGLKIWRDTLEALYFNIRHRYNTPLLNPVQKYKGDVKNIALSENIGEVFDKLLKLETKLRVELTTKRFGL